MRTAALLALAGALVATPALADTTVIHAGAVIVDADSAPRGASTITVTDGRIVSITDGFAPGPADVGRPILRPLRPLLERAVDVGGVHVVPLPARWERRGRGDAH